MVVSEPARPEPHALVLSWLDKQMTADLAISVLTLGEIGRGVARLDGGKRKTKLEKWLTAELPAQFESRVLQIDERVAVVWGELTAEADRAGRPLPVVDGLILATAKVHDLTIVTRNEDDFHARGVPMLNPYR